MPDRPKYLRLIPPPNQSSKSLSPGHHQDQGGSSIPPSPSSEHHAESFASDTEKELFEKHIELDIGHERLLLYRVLAVTATIGLLLLAREFALTMLGL